MTWLIALRELKERGLGKGFLISTAIMLIAVVVAAFAITVFDDDDETGRQVTVGVVDAGYSTAIVDRDQLIDTLEIGSEALEVSIADVGASDEIERVLNDADVDVVFDGSTLVWSQFPDAQLDSFMRNQIAVLQSTTRAGERGLGPADLAAIFTPAFIAEERLDTDDADQFGMRMVTSMVAGFGLFILLQAWGAQIMMGVVEEKQSRVIEIVLSKVHPRQLLAGKVIGIGLLGLIQAAILIGGLALALALTTNVEVPDGVWGAIPLIGVCFVLGFLFYGAAFAAVGAMATRIEDVQSAQLPAMLPLMISYFLLASTLSNPTGILPRILSFVPFSAPLAIPFRHAHSPMPWWQIAISLGLLAVGALIMVTIAGWVYRRSILRVDGRVKIKDLFSEWRSLNNT